MFLSNLLLKEKYTLKNRDMHIQFAGHTPESSEKSSEKTPKGSEKSSEKMLRMIKADAHITIKALADQLGITTRAVEKNIAKLKTENRIKRIRGDKK